MRFNCRSTPQAADTLSETEIKSSKRAKSKAKASSKKKAKTGGATSNTPAKEASVAPHPSPLPHVLCPLPSSSPHPFPPSRISPGAPPLPLLSSGCSSSTSCSPLLHLREVDAD